MSQEPMQKTKPGKQLKYGGLAVAVIVVGIIAWGAFAYVTRPAPDSELNTISFGIVNSN